MAWPVLPHGFLGAQGSETDSYRIERSLRFNSADSAYLSRTYGSGTSATTWTISCWVKRSSFGAATCIFSERLSSNANVVTQLDFQSSDTFRLVGTNASGSVTLDLITTQVFRDPSAWFHLVVAADSTQATASERFKIYINGSQVTSLGTATYPAQNSTFGVFSASEHNIGRRFLAVSGTDALFNGYITEFHAIDGQALTPSNFGETDAITGRWKAKAYSGTYGTNGFYLNFSDNSSLTTTSNVGIGKDFSGNGNYWATNGLSVTAGAGNDSLVDSPTNYGTDTGVGGEVRGNYATWNPLNLNNNGGNKASISNGNLTATFNNTDYCYVYTTFNGAVTNKTILGCELYIENRGAYAYGVAIYLGDVGIRSDGLVGTNTTTFTTGDYIQAKYSTASGGTVTFYKNGTQIYQATSTGNFTYPFLALQGSGASVSANFGQQAWNYSSALSGATALCTTNLPTPTIQRPSKYMDVVTYTGNGTSPRTISGFGFSTDFLWIKNRDSNYNPIIFDTVRGAGSNKLLSTNTTQPETFTDGSNYGYVSAFTSDGFSTTTGTIDFGLTNANGTRYVAWSWDEAPIAGMDIVSASLSGTSPVTVNHSLGVAPKMIIGKIRSNTSNWYVNHSGLANNVNYYVMLNSTAAQASSSNIWDGAPTSTSFVVGNPQNGWNGGTVGSANYVFYLFAEVEGFSKFGSYTGNGSSDGPFVWCGFRPRWVMVKQTNTTTSNSNWFILDSARNTFNTTDAFVHANTSNAEYGASVISDFLSNGFKLRIADSLEQLNTSTKTYIFAAFAESPFKYARAR